MANHILKNSILMFALSLLVSVFYFAGIFHQSTTVVQNQTSAILTSQTQSSLPLRLIIPTIRVDAVIEEGGLTPNGSMEAPKGPDTVMWFKFGPHPGEKGSAVIAGHYGTWINDASSVFDDLNTLKEGDKIYVKNDDGQLISFTVKETRIYNPDEIVPDIFNKSDLAHLNLITCNGAWIPSKKTYTERLIVFTDKD